MDSIGADQPPQIVRVPYANLWAYLTDLRNWGELLGEPGSFPGVNTIETPPPYPSGTEVLGRLNTGAKIVPTKWTVLENDPKKGVIRVKVSPNPVFPHLETTLTCSVKGMSEVESSVHMKVEWVWTNPVYKFVMSHFPPKKQITGTTCFVSRLQAALKG